MRRFLASCIALLAAPALAAAADPETLWRCVILPAEKPAIGCMLATAAPVDPEDDPPAPHPGIVARIWHDPASLDNETIVIPLYAPPLDKAFVQRLARSVMCGGARARCRVEFAEDWAPER